MVGELVRREADIAIAPLTINSQREQVDVIVIIIIVIVIVIIAIIVIAIIIIAMIISSSNRKMMMITKILIFRWLTSQNPSCPSASPS